MCILEILRRELNRLARPYQDLTDSNVVMRRHGPTIRLLPLDIQSTLLTLHLQSLGSWAEPFTNHYWITFNTIAITITITITRFNLPTGNANRR